MWCWHDVLRFLFKFQRFSAYSAASIRAAGRGRRGKTQKGRSGVWHDVLLFLFRIQRFSACSAASGLYSAALLGEAGLKKLSSRSR